MRETELYRQALSCAPVVRRDRRDALYVAKDVSQEGIFRAQTRTDGLTALYMTDECLRVLDASLPSFAQDELYACLLRLKGRGASEEEMSFLTKCVKRFETREGFTAQTEKELRQMCALCLRTKKGGGALYLARALMLMGG